MNSTETDREGGGGRMCERRSVGAAIAVRQLSVDRLDVLLAKASKEKSNRQTPALYTHSNE